MQVDPEVLRAFATEVDRAAAAISGLDIGNVAATSADCVAGSDTQYTARVVGLHLGAAAKFITDDITEMATAVRGAGERYEVDDATLAGSFAHLF